MKEKEFLLCLERQKDLVESKLAKARQEGLSRNEKVKALDKIAEQLGATLFQALELSTPYTKNLGKREPWWDEKCQLAAREFSRKMSIMIWIGQLVLKICRLGKLARKQDFNSGRR